MIMRPAQTADARAMAALAGELGYPSSEAEVVDRLRRLGEQPDQHAVYVVENPPGRIAAWLHVRASYQVESDPFAEIGGLVVGERDRGARIGEALVRRAETWALERGFTRLRVRSNVIRERAHGFYERIGFERVKNQAVFEKRFSRSEQPEEGNP